MVSRFEVWVDDVALSSISPAIRIADIIYSRPQMSNSGYNYPGRSGSVITARTASTTSCTVTFEVREYDPAKRMGIVNDINKWACTWHPYSPNVNGYGVNGASLVSSGKGILKTSDRPGQVLILAYAEPAVISSSLKWTDTLSVTFVAVYPYWVSDETVTVTLNPGYTDTVDLTDAGTADYVLLDVSDTLSSAAAASWFFAADGHAYERFSITHTTAGAEVICAHTRGQMLMVYGNGTSSGLPGYIKAPIGRKIQVISPTNASAARLWYRRCYW